VCEALTSSLDQAIEALVHPLPDDVAVVAIGGYGRAELSPYSDVDLMLLHTVDDPSELAAGLFRPLWDAKLRVGHAVRTLKEASTAAKERFDTQTTLLTSRLVAGDEALFQRLMETVAAVTRARPLRRYLVAEERERREATPHLLMATDVKTGRGGLRTLQGFDWEQRREELIGRFSTHSFPEEEESGEILLQTRNALHAVTGRAHDVFSPDLREQVARWLDLDVFEVAGRLVHALQTVDGLATKRWPEVVEDRPKGVWAHLVGKPPPISVTRKPTFEEFVWILETGEQGRIGFERLWESGLLEDVLPEWDEVRSLPQLAPFHEHPAASHLWRTVDEMLALTAEDGQYGRVARELDSPEVLLTAAFLHDVGKGHGGDHAVVGAGIAQAFCRRMSVSSEQEELISGAVRHHLLLATTATRRDLDDPAVIDEVAATVGRLDLLQVLYLLTIADSRATGPTMWGDWKATLVRTLFLRCAAGFDGDRSAEAGTSRAAVLAALDAGRHVEAESNIDSMPAEYLRSASTGDVLWHLDLVASLEGASIVEIRPGQPVETAVVVGHSRPGFRRQVAEAFAANGIDVLEARLLTRGDGVVVDTFRVTDDMTGGSVEAGRWESLRVDVEAALLGELDTGSKVAARAAAYETSGGEKPEVRGSIDAASGDLVLMIKCADRIGRLAEIITVLNDCGLAIKLAKIDSREGEVIDTFHVDVAAVGGAADAIELLEHRIASAISP
jgi:[protein-PII] uridylyltransferase